MTSDGIEGEGRTLVVGLDDVTVGDQSEFNESLETVADTKH